MLHKQHNAWPEGDSFNFIVSFLLMSNVLFGITSLVSLLHENSGFNNAFKVPQHKA